MSDSSSALASLAPLRQLIEQWKTEATYFRDRKNGAHGPISPYVATAYSICADELAAALLVVSQEGRGQTNEEHVCGLQGYQRGQTPDPICPACALFSPSKEGRHDSEG